MGTVPGSVLTEFSKAIARSSLDIGVSEEGSQAESAEGLEGDGKGVIDINEFCVLIGGGGSSGGCIPGSTRDKEWSLPFLQGKIRNTRCECVQD